MKKTVLITGSSGYIGSHLCKRLNSNFNVIGLDLQKPKADILNYLIADIRQLTSLDFEVDTVVHLAALVKTNESVYNPVNYYKTNLNGTLNLIKNVELTCKNFIFASTGSAEFCNSPYSVSKRAAEDCVQEICNLLDIPYTIFRFYNVIGSSGFYPTNPDSLFYNLLTARHRGVFTVFGNDYQTRDGTPERDYVHVDEICGAIEQAINCPSNKIENLGHGKGYTVNELIDLFKQVNQCDFDVLYGPRRKGDLERTVLSNPSSYLLNLYDIKDLVKIPTIML